MTNKERYLKLCDVFNKEYSEAECALNYDTPFRLLVAVQLSAQRGRCMHGRSRSPDRG